MVFKEVRLSDRNIFERFLGCHEHYLSAYQFSNIFIWRKLFRIFYAVLSGHLCVFFKDKYTCFMYLPPLSPKTGLGNSRRHPEPSVVRECFSIMDERNRNKEISRIENAPEQQLEFYQELGYRYFNKPGDYLCRRQDIASLSGNRLKSKRASYNYFNKHYDFEFRPFLRQDTPDCLALYREWARQREEKFPDSIYAGMLEDGFLCHREAMEHFTRLGLIGYVIRIKDDVAGYSFGFPVNSKTFCVLFEVCDLSYRGVSEFIFSRFCRQLPGYEYVNIMDDSQLLNLRRVKLSYRPVRIVANHIIKRD